MVGLSPAEDEAVKRNTDCVYFLASPLTCKKGSECEYRHSDIARVNPRDCWFWLHGNCLNPKCGFRHPPLDALLGTQTPTSAVHSVTPTQNAATPTSAVHSVTPTQNAAAPTSNAPNASSKQAVPCVFFQKGFCVKGDWCPFLHAPNSAVIKTPQASGLAPAAELSTFKNASGGHEKFSLEKKAPPSALVNSFKVSRKEKPFVEIGRAPPRNVFPLSGRTLHVSGVTSVSNGNPLSWSDRTHQPLTIGETEGLNKDGEISREPSPGFDVLVDDEQRDSDYFPNDDHYGMPDEHEARDEYDINSSIDYNLISDIDRERFQDPMRYDLHEIHRGRQSMEMHRNLSERTSGGDYLERRPYSRADIANKSNDLDLRHRLNKRKKSNGLRSVINHEYVSDRHVEDRRYPGFQRGEQHSSLRDNSLSSQLRGRIRLLGRSSSPNEIDAILRPELSRLSPVRTNSSHQGRIRDRIKARLGSDFHNGSKNHQGPHYKREMIAYNSGDFTGPKSLSELKNLKNAQPHEVDQQSLGKRKNMMLDGDQQSSGAVSFEGPKPLEEILKRKRGDTIGIPSQKKSPDRENADKNEKEGNDMAKIPSSTFVSIASDWTVTPIVSNKDVFKSAPVDKTESEETRSGVGTFTARHSFPSTVVSEDGVNAIDEVDKDGESDYEQVGAENYDLYDGDIAGADGEYMEEEDDDDFAKKMGVLYS